MPGNWLFKITGIKTEASVDWLHWGDEFGLIESDNAEFEGNNSEFEASPQAFESKLQDTYGLANANIYFLAQQ